MLENIIKSTIVNFASGAIEYTGKILAILELKANKVGVIADKTCFHPIDYKWPDQPGDKGKIIIIDNNIEMHVENSFIAAINKNTKSYIYDKEDVKSIKIKDDYHFVVVHVVENGFREELVQYIHDESVIKLHVDDEYRKKLSSSHTACHLAALALNKATTPFWKNKKEIKRDSLGSFDFDKICIEKSKILPEKSVDIYRLGKSISKKGFNVNEFIANLSEVELDINNQLNKWIELSKTKEVKCKVIPDESFLTEKRVWQCYFPEGGAVIPCGGTHITNLNMFKKIKVKLDSVKLENAANIVMNTTAQNV